ncbi:hypothetical protein [Pseudonocardia alni]|uniref:hypothetical protein n=1 Tax=Pseudonocardia alni TaxID=33907 RepID=UPI0027A61CB9|nr:hypothetical protein PaSha_12730 [Pseudonocardia alni]
MTHTPEPRAVGPVRGGRWGRAAVWLPGLAVALGAAVATAHGLFEVAAAARVPAGIAWIYPLITDGLALVAYTATARLRRSAARYAWSVVIVSAGLSGLAQAVYLASDSVTAGGDLAVNSALRFGIGAWPAIAAAVVAHLLYLLAESRPDGPLSGPGRPVRTTTPVRPDGRTGRDTPSHPVIGHAARAVLDGPVIGPERPRPSGPVPVLGATSDPGTSSPPVPPPPSGPAAESPARDHARTVAERHRDRHGALPTVRELQALADVGRGTAADALKSLRDTPQQATTGLHLVPDEPDTRTHQ